MTQRRNPQPAAQAAAKAYNAFNLASFTIGAKAANIINVAVVLKDARGQALQSVGQCTCYLSDNSDGSTMTATATTSAIAVHTNGVILDTPTSGKVVDMISTVAGLFDLDITQTASPVTYYLAVCMPDGSVVVSSAITF